MSESSTLFTVYGTPGDDFLIGTNGDDLLDGGAGYDQLQGLAGNDLLIGGIGNDQLDGGSGNDTYVFAAGDGFDTIWEGTGATGPEAGGTDTVQLGDGYDPAMTFLERWGNDLVIRNAQTGDQIVVFEHFGSYLDGSTRSAIEQITFADGTVWNTEAIANRLASMNANWTTDNGDTVGGSPMDDFMSGMGGNDTLSGGQGNDWISGDAGNDRLFGGEGNDTLYGQDGNDTLAGGTGNDVLDGGAGSDTYRFNSGDGVDTITDMPMAPGESNRVVFGAGIGFTDLFAYADPYTGGVTIDVGTAGDRLQLAYSAPDPYGPHAVDTFQFADGTIATYGSLLGFGSYQQGSVYNDWLYGTYYADSLYGNGGDDSLYGDGGNDILTGGQGYDYLSGGQGHDTYYYNRGDGVDFIDDYAFAPMEGNRVVFGEGITADDLRLRTDGWSSWIEIAPADGAMPTGPIDVLQFSNFSPLDAKAPRSVETFEFADGSTLGYEELIARGFYLGGTDWNDYLVGTGLNDRIYGYAGDDTLVGMEGHDTLTGGTGNDWLYGGAGSDTYAIAAGDGYDTVWDGAGMPFVDTGDVDTVQLGAGYDPDTTMLERWGNDLVIRNAQSGDQIAIREHFGNDYDSSIQSAIEQITFADGTVWNTEAIANRLASMNANWTSEAGDTVGGTPWSDYLYGMGGNDTLSGGQGDDTIIGGDGNDRLFGGEGSDYLAGEAGDDVLSGGAGNDWLDGGLGNDTYLFRLGDGVDSILDAPMNGEPNRVIFGDGIRFEDLTVTPGYEFGGVSIGIGANGDRLDLHGSFPDPYGPQTVSSFEFADGTIATFDALTGFGLYFRGGAGDDWMNGSSFADSLYGGAGNDGLYGMEGNDILAGGDGDDVLHGQDGDDDLAGGAGNDVLLGGTGNDTYRFNRGDGMDLIGDVAMPGAGNRVVFGAGIVAADLTLRMNGYSLEIGIGSDGDGLLLDYFDPFNPDGARPVDTFEFADGSVLSFAQWLERGVEISGTSLDDVLDGTYANDTLFGGLGGDVLAGHDGNDVLHGEAGDDTLHGGAGDDVLIGGAGQDSLLGGLGSDTYVYNPGDGDDLVLELESAPGDADRVTFGSGITAQELTVTRGGYNDFDLHIAFAGSAGTLTFMGWFNPEVSGQIEEFHFADGTVLSGTQVADLVNYAPTVAQPLADQTVLEDTVLSLTLPAGAFADSDNDSLSYTATLADGSALPAWLDFDPVTRTFTGTPGNNDVGSLELRVTATDALGESAADSFVLTVENTNDAPYVAQPVYYLSATEGQTLLHQLDAGTFADPDAIHGDALAYTATLADGSPLPAWLGFDAASLTFSGTPANGDVGNLNLRLTATDIAGASVNMDFLLTVENVNDAPVVAAALADQVVNEESPLQYTIPSGAFSDPDAIHGDTLSYSATLADGTPLPAWLSFDAATRSFSGTPANGESGTYDIQVTATDNAGASVADIFRITVADTLSNTFTGTSGADTLNGTVGADILQGLGGSDILNGYGGNDLLDGGNGYDTMRGGTGDDTYVVNTSGDIVVENAGEGIDTVQSTTSYTLGTNVENLTLLGTANRSGTGNNLDNVLLGNVGNNTLTGGAGDDVLDGGAGSDQLRGGTGNDTYVFGRGSGQDTISENDATVGNTDTVAMDVNALDLVFSRVSGTSRLAMSVYGEKDMLSVNNWYSGTQYQTEVIQSADGYVLLNTQVDQLIQAMAQFSAQTGLSWDQAIAQRPDEVQAVLSAYWQPAA